MTGLDDVKLHLVDGLDEALAFHEWLGTRRPDDVIAVDTETTGLVVGVDRVRMIQFGDTVHGWAVPREEWLGLARWTLANFQGIFAMHNAKFDCGMLQASCGIDVPRHRVRDTRIMAHILEPHMSTALKNQAARHVDRLAAGAQGVLATALGPGGGWSWETVPYDFPDYWTYAALDTVLTAHLYEVHWPAVQADAPDAFELEAAVQWVIERMERYGAHIDVAYAREQRDKFEQFVATAEKWILEEYGVKAGSNAAIIKILQEAGFAFDKKTASGALSLDKDVLEHIDHPLAQTVLQRRQLQKLASTYLAHFVDEVDARDLIHPSINTLGARTSRMSMERPNLQNLPRKSEDNPAAETVRNCVKARDGHTLLMCDFDQIEMRLLAHIADDKGLQAAFRSEHDFFVNLARDIFQDPTLVKADPRRQITKNAGYAKIYGAGAAKMALTAGVPEDQMRGVMSRFDTLYPGARSLQRRVEQVAQQRLHTEGQAYVRCPVTRRRQIADQGKLYALVNYLIQGAAAAVLKQKILEADAAGLGRWMVVPVHDELILDVPTDELRDAAHALTAVMNDDGMFNVPITASASFGERWGSKETWRDEVST